MSQLCRTLYTVAEIGAIEQLLPIRALAKLARLNTTLRDIVQWRLTKCKALYDRFKHKFARALYSRLLRNPVVYTGRAMTCQKIANVRFRELYGIQLYDDSPSMFTHDWLAHNSISFTSVTLWLKKRVSFTVTITLTYFSNFAKQVTVDEIHPLGADLYYVHINPVLVNNPIMLGCKNVRFTSIYMNLLPSSELAPSGGPTYSNVDFLQCLVDRVFVRYLTSKCRATDYSAKPYLYQSNMRTNSIMSRP